MFKKRTFGINGLFQGECGVVTQIKPNPGLKFTLDDSTFISMSFVLY